MGEKKGGSVSKMNPDGLQVAQLRQRHAYLRQLRYNSKVSFTAPGASPTGPYLLRLCTPINLFSRSLHTFQ